MKINVKKIIKGLIVVVIMVLIVTTIFYLFPVMRELSTSEGQMAFKEKVEQSSIWGLGVLIFLQVAQMFLLVLPGEPLEILAGMCYGVVGGTIFIFSTVFVVSCGIFWLSRKFGKKFVYEFFKKERIDKIEKSKLFRNKKLVEYIMLILFLIPGSPKDLLTFIGGLLPVKPLRFILIATFGRFPSVISSTIVGANLIQGDFMTVAVVYGITFVLTVAFIILVNIFDKRKIAKKAMKELK